MWRAASLSRPRGRVMRAAPAPSQFTYVTLLMMTAPEGDAVWNMYRQCKFREMHNGPA
jgi:hypothetical protein